MSEQREVVNPATGKVSTVSEALNREPEEMKKLRAEKKAVLARVLDRGIIIDRLHVDLPEGVHGEWVHNSKLAIAEKEALGFEVDTQYATSNALHKDGEGGTVVGDAIFMVCPKETKELIDEVRRDNFVRMHGKDGKGQREEREFASQTEQALGLPVVDESRSRTMRKKDLQDALNQNYQSDKPTSTTQFK